MFHWVHHYARGLPTVFSLKYFDNIHTIQQCIQQVLVIQQNIELLIKYTNICYGIHKEGYSHCENMQK